MNLAGWTYLFAFSPNLDIYAKGKKRIGVDKNSRQVVSYEVGPNKSEPRCAECLDATHKLIQQLTLCARDCDNVT